MGPRASARRRAPGGLGASRLGRLGDSANPADSSTVPARRQRRDARGLSHPQSPPSLSSISAAGNLTFFSPGGRAVLAGPRQPGPLL